MHIVFTVTIFTSVTVVEVVVVKLRISHSVGKLLLY